MVVKKTGYLLPFVGTEDLIFSLIPLVSYKNADTQKKDIIKDNKGKSGVYKWKNNINNKEYVGSSINLLSRFYSYYSLKFLVKQSRSLICKALLKYGHSVFTLEILEYCQPSDTIAREQYYIDLLKPEYNILKIAGSSLGIKRSAETKLKISTYRAGRILSLDHKNKISASMIGRKHSIESIAKMKNRVLSDSHLTKLRKHLANLNTLQGTKIKIIDTLTNETTLWNSTYKAAEGIGVSQSTIWRYLKTNKLYKKRYAIVLANK